MKRALLIWFCVAGLVVMGCSPTPDTADSFGSVGTLGDSWIEIWDWYDLDAIRSNLSGSFVLMTDLDSTTAGYNELAGPMASGGQGWQPIGTSANRFSGILDGQGYEIRDLFIHRPNEWHVGLFGYTDESSSLQHVSLVDFSIIGDEAADARYYGSLIGVNRGTISYCHSVGTLTDARHFVGGLAGYNWGDISNCSFRGTVTGGGNYVGGLVGHSRGTVTQCYSSATVTASGGTVGGLVGGNHYGVIASSFSSGSVSGHSIVGGLLGMQVEAIVVDCYSTSDVHVHYEKAGGLVGVNADYSTVSSSYSIGRVSDIGWSVGGLIGVAGATTTASNCFWDIETSGMSASAGGTGKTTIEMMDIRTFSDPLWSDGLHTPWDITAVADETQRNVDHIWNVVDTQTYPFLSWQPLPVALYDLTISSTDGGLVFEPGEGTYTYEDGTVVALVAEAGIGYQFVNWAGDVSTIANVNAPETTITMNGDYSIVASFAVIPPWPMFGQNPRRTGESPYTGPEIPYLKWSFTTLGSVRSSPAVGTDGTIYVGSYDNNLYAVDPDGSEKWRFTTGGLVGSSPTLGPDGTIYVGSSDNNLYAVNPDGSEKWSFMTGNAVYSSPTIGADGTIYVGSDDSNLYAIDPDGSEKWHFNTGWLHVESSPAIGDDGTIYVGSLNHNLHAIDRDGSEKWSFMTGNAVYSSPAVGADGTIYAGSYDNNLYAINPDGSEKWRFATSEPVHSSPAIGPDGTIYIGSWDNNLYAVNSDGSEKWRFTTGQPVLSSPAIGTDGTIYVGSNDGNFYAVNSDGSEKWRFATGGYVWSSPAIDIDGTIYVGSYDYRLYAITEAPNYTLNILSSDGGSVTEPGEGGFQYVAGTVVGLVASAYEGYSFVNWTGDVGTVGSVDSAETTITLNGDYSIVANFAINQYSLTYYAGPGGSITGDTPQTVDHGDDGTPVEAVPNPGYRFVDWSDSSTDNPRTDTNVTADITVTANFAIEQYTLTTGSTDGGSVATPGEGTFPYDYGTDVDLVATPDNGYDFVNWTGDVSTIADVNSASTSVTINSDYSITANFEAITGVQTQCVESATGTGEVCFTISHGFIEELEALPVIPPGAPAGIMFPHGMFSFKVTGLALGQTVTITIELPEPVPTGTRWWKEHMGAWYSVPVDMIGPNTITITLTDGVFPGDTDGTEDGVITDPGGPGNPAPLDLPSYVVGWETSPVNKLAVLAPWITLLAAIVAGAGLLMLRRRGKEREYA